MRRILSALVLLSMALVAIWWSLWTTLAVGAVAGALAFVEYARLAEKLGARVARPVAGVATIASMAAMGWPRGSSGELVEIVLLSALVALGATAVALAGPTPSTLASVAASLFPALYIGMPIGAIVSLRADPGTDAVLLLLAVVVLSDTAQYYSGRLFGRRPLAPAISPNKTREGALGGLVAGAAAAWWLGRWWLPTAAPAFRFLLGATVAAAGIVGDLFESQLKRSAGVKDTSTLIPGHGGILDRIDSWLFAGPVYYVLVRYVL